MEKIFHNQNIDAIAKDLGVDINAGLSASVATGRLAQYGENVLEKGKRKSKLQMLIEQFKSFMILILLAAGLISGLLGEWTDTVIIILVVVINAVIGVFQENKAEESLAALSKMSAPNATVLREGEIHSIPSAELVIGDIVILETGDLVPCDLRLIESINLKIGEAALTGESVPVEKNVSVIYDIDAPLGDRTNMAYSSSLVSYGRGRGIVVATGMRTEVGKIAALLQETDNKETPLKRKLEHLGKVMGVAVLIICAIIFGVGLIEGNDPFEMFLVAVSLAVAAIPEGLPAIATIVLSIGVQRMVKRHAIIRTLTAVETLGSATVICSDKTGTLTQNKMTVEKLGLLGNILDLEEARTALTPDLALLVECGVLCNDGKATYDKNSISYLGDPTETALLYLGDKLGIQKDKVERSNLRVGEVPFDSDRKLMSTCNEFGKGYRVYTKGGVDELLGCCTKILENGRVRTLTPRDRSLINEENLDMAKGALRVLAFAYKDVPKIDMRYEENLVFIGLMGMIDPPRVEAAEAVRECFEAGITPVMITGDHLITAKAIGKTLGILKEGDGVLTGTELEAMSDEELRRNVEHYRVYARVAPHHKVRIVDAWQSRGHVVAMTGDGVNDAPALKRADIGAAMGITGTDVAKEAADMVLTDDNFATIVSAVEEGRRIYDNILKAIQFLLSCNVGEIITLFVAVMLSWGTPLLPIHILWVNLVTDSFSALALGVEPAEPNIMRSHAVRDSNKIFTGGIVWRICYQGALVGVLTITAFVYGSKVDLATGQTMAFAVLAFSQLVHAFNIRSHYISVFSRKMEINKPLWLATFGSGALMLAVLFVPALQQVFRLATLDMAHLVMVVILSLTPILVVEVAKLLKINASLYEK